jgi:4-amino-4-deoxy-L-arabinose transferase-like glycosyltransferase
MSTTILPPTTRSAAATSERSRSRLRSLLLGSEADASWARPALLVLLAITVIAYVWDLSSSGYANSFYAAAVQAGTRSWKAFFFGSIDASNFITVDKPPASLWVMELSGRLFGFSTLSMLVPQVLEGLVAVALLHGAVKRWFGAGAGLLAGGLLAVTPVAALMFRFNNPDALLVCLLVAGAYCLTRALEGASTRWVVAVGVMIGFAFLAKMMQAFLVLPAFTLVYLVAAPTHLRRRLAQLLAGAGAITISAGWWVAIVALWPAGSRPMIDGSSDNSIINLILGYNGLGRIFGSSGGGAAGGGAGGSFSGAAGPLRLFNDLMGGQASWLLPAAAMVLVVGLVITWRAPRTDRSRAALLLWGGWLVVTAAVFSFSTGIIHTYYTVALAPAIAALVAIGSVSVWRRRNTATGRFALGVAVAVTAAWSWVLLHRASSWLPWLSWLVVSGAVLTIAGLVLATRTHAVGRRVWAAVATGAVIACLVGPVAYAGQTVSTAHTGSTPSAGPTAGNSAPGGPPAGGQAPTGSTSGTAPSGLGGGSAGNAPSAAPGLPSGAAGRTSGAAGLPSGAAGRTSGAAGRTSGAAGRTSAAAGVPSGTQAGGGPGAVSVSSALTAALKRNHAHYRWVAATSGSESAASLELATGGDPVMAIGGFNGEGGNLTLAQFKAYVAGGEIHYYIAGSTGQMGGPTAGAGSATSGPTGAASAPGEGSDEIAAWVEAHYRSTTIGGQTVYDLTEAK